MFNKTGSKRTLTVVITSVNVLTFCFPNRVRTFRIVQTGYELLSTTTT